jgi:hypothetical protein
MWLRYTEKPRNNYLTHTWEAWEPPEYNPPTPLEYPPVIHIICKECNLKSKIEISTSAYYIENYSCPPTCAEYIVKSIVE